MDRRTFLRSTGLAVGGLAAFSMTPRSVEAAASASSDAKTEIKKSAEKKGVDTDSISKEIDKVKDDIDDLTGSIKRDL